MTLVRTTLTLFIIWIYSPVVGACEIASESAGFQQRVDALHQVLKQKSTKLATPVELKQAAKQHITDRWDLDSSLIGMLGKTLWKTLAAEDQTQLQDALADTLTRYFMEAYDYYSGQPIGLKEVALNSKGTKGWLRLNVEIEYAPDISIDIAVVRRQDQWLYRDVRVQGISYLTLKRGHYQALVEEGKVKQLIAELNDKNTSYFQEVGLISDELGAVGGEPKL
jgi:ABC-type transporter MlaC component